MGYWKDKYDKYVGTPAHEAQKAGANVIYNTLDPYYGEDAIFEDVTTAVEQGSYIEATVEAAETVFVDPVKETVIEPIIETGEKVADAGSDYKDEILRGADKAGDIATLGLAVAAIFLLTKR